MKPEPSMNPQVARSRAAAMKAAGELLLAEGWDAVTHVSVSERSGVGRTTLYRHWPTVEQLLYEVLLTDCTVSHPTPTGETRADLIEELDGFRVQLHSPMVERPMLAIMDRASINDDFARLCSDLHEACALATAKIIRAAQDKGELDSHLDVSYADAQLAGPLMYQRLLGRKTLTRDFIEDLVDDFLRTHRADRQHSPIP